MKKIVLAIFIIALVVSCKNESETSISVKGVTHGKCISTPNTRAAESGYGILIVKATANSGLSVEHKDAVLNCSAQEEGKLIVTVRKDGNNLYINESAPASANCVCCINTAFTLNGLSNATFTVYYTVDNVEFAPFTVTYNSGLNQAISLTRK